LSDPIGIEGGINLYPYAKNNSIKFKDALGLYIDTLQPGNGWNDQYGTDEFPADFTLIVYGNFCGVGAKKELGKSTDSPYEDSDCVDEACRQHDICYRDRKLKWFYPRQLFPNKVICDSKLCKDTNKCPNSCNNSLIKIGINLYFDCLSIQPFAL
jgi:hypothetical protein